VEIIKYKQLKNAINGGAVRLKKRLIYRVEIRHVVDPNINYILTELSPSTKFKAKQFMLSLEGNVRNETL